MAELTLKRQFPQLKVISFDLDDTLWDGTEVILRAEQAMFDWILKHVPQVLEQFDKESISIAKMDFAKQNSHLIHKTSQLREHFLRHLFTLCGVDNTRTAARECFLHFYQVRQQVRLFDSVPSTLQRLKQDYQLIAITNGNACTQTIGLDKFFALSLNAEDFSAPKPDAEIFEYALSSIGIAANQCLHVGDHPYHDMLGAQQIGMHTAWLDDGSRQWPHEFLPDIVIQDVVELISIA
ncbi:HAD family hydrolase [Bermanella sp. R86510]|uniref:HAD family hydrolase n=1 Tax=unclassified Bermanella TaxID=2627862 RepID=UPI0037C6E835